MSTLESSTSWGTCPPKKIYGPDDIIGLRLTPALRQFHKSLMQLSDIGALGALTLRYTDELCPNMLTVFDTSGEQQQEAMRKAALMMLQEHTASPTQNDRQHVLDAA